MVLKIEKCVEGDLKIGLKYRIKSNNETIVSDLDDELVPYIKVIKQSRSSKTYERYE